MLRPMVYLIPLLRDSETAMHMSYHLIIKMLIILFLLPSLTGCNKNQTYSYYMRNPEVLKAALTVCQTNNPITKEEITHCEIVLYSATKMLSLINEQQADPEKFGQRILNAEMNYMKLKKVVNDTQVSLDKIKNQQISTADLMAAKDDLYKVRKNCSDQLQEIKVLLAVVGLGRPD